jgi:uncharacterized protein (TIGR00369 family)
MSTLEKLLAEAKSTGDWSKLADAIPYARFLGLSLAVEQAELICAMRYSDKLIGNASIPALHGGTLGGLLESAAVFQLVYESDVAVLPKIINITVDYLRSARGLDTFASAVITKQGRRVTNVRAIAWQDDRQKPVAAAIAHFLV